MGLRTFFLGPLFPPIPEDDMPPTDCRYPFCFHSQPCVNCGKFKHEHEGEWAGGPLYRCPESDRSRR